jgi:hypothetical protein
MISAPLVTKKNELVVIGLAAAILLSFYGNFQLRSPLSWSVATVFILINSALIIFNPKVKKITLQVIIFSAMWLIIPVMLTPGILNWPIHLKAILETLMYVLFFSCVFSLINISQERFFYLFKVIVITVFLISLLSIVDYFFISKPINFTGFHSNPNTYAVLLVFLLANIVSFPGKMFKSKTIHFLAISLISFQVLLTGSSKGLVGLAIVFSLFVLFKARKSKRILSLLVLVIFFMSVPLLAEKSFNRLSDKISSVTQFNVDASDEKVIGHDSGLVRLFLFYDSIRIIGDNWITGVGVNNGQFYLRLPASFERLMSSINSQNNFSETLLNGGIIAFLLYYAPLIYILSRSIGRSHKNDFEYAIISLIGLKIFLDLGMKSYNDASHIMIVALVFYYHFMSTRLRYEN